MKYDTAKIIETIKAAMVEADAVDAFHADQEDGGTCNFDTAYLRVPGMLSKQAAVIEAAFPKNLVSLQNYSWHGRILMLHHNHGQANRRSRMCSAAYKVFKASGLPCGEYLQMD